MQVYLRVGSDQSVVINTFLTKFIYPIYLPGINKYGLLTSVSCPVNRNVNKFGLLTSVSRPVNRNANDEEYLF